MVDNNSTDDSVAIARRHAAVELYAEPQQGAYAARNCGVAAATGRLIAFTDPDCVPRPDWLRRLTAAMDDPAAMVVSGRDRPTGPGRAVRLLGEYDHVKEELVFAGADASAYYAHTNNLITRREVLDRVGPFDERARGGDVVFVQRALAAYGAGAVRYEPGAMVEHLEIARAAVYFQKARLYGRSARRYVRVVRAETAAQRRAFPHLPRDRAPLAALPRRGDVPVRAAGRRSRLLSPRLVVRAAGGESAAAESRELPA